MSFYELYNNVSIDLLNDASATQSNPTKIFPVEGSVLRKFINVTEVEIRDRKHAEDMLNIGRQNRHTSSTTFNEHSSRSHALVTMRLQRKNGIKSGKKQSIPINDPSTKNDAMVSSRPAATKGRHQASISNTFSKKDVEEQSSLNVDCQLDGCMVFVDMAGTESTATTPRSSGRYQEGTNINLTTLELRRVLNLLKTNPSKAHFRGSSLTNLL